MQKSAHINNQFLYKTYLKPEAQTYTIVHKDLAIN